MRPLQYSSVCHWRLTDSPLIDLFWEPDWDKNHTKVELYDLNILNLTELRHFIVFVVVVVS